MFELQKTTLCILLFFSILGFAQPAYCIQKESADSSSILSKQNQTMAKMRIIGTTVEAYAIDNNHYPNAKDVVALAKIVQPVYIKSLPLADEWGNSFRYIVSADLQHYWIISYGADGTPESALYKNNDLVQDLKEEATNDPNKDIVFHEGSFIRHPPMATMESYKAVKEDSSHDLTWEHMQKQTMIDLRMIANSVEAYSVDNSSYPDAKDMNALAKIVQPRYIGKLPLLDPWGNPYRYVVTEDLELSWIMSCGADGKPDSGLYNEKNVPKPNTSDSTERTNPQDDIIIHRGRFIRYPKGLQN